MAGLHVAVIMDGNGRWASCQGLPRVEGHRAGADAVRRAVEAAGRLGIGTLTLYAFSSDNWKRPAREVGTLMRLFFDYLTRETARCVKEGIRVRVIGRRDRLPGFLLPAIEAAEKATARGSRLEVRIAVDYSARDQIARAAARLRKKDLTRESLARELAPEVDLLIRTGGEQRLSDFLLWECAYAELVFLERMWPEFEGADLERAVEEFRRRDRRFGAAPAVLAG